MNIWSPLWYYINFRISSSFVKNAIGILVVIALSLYIALDNKDNFFFTFIVDTIADVPIPPPSPFVFLFSVPAPPSFHPSPHCCVYPLVIHICSLANPFTFFHPAPPSPFTAVSLFHVFMPLFLFCMQGHFKCHLLYKGYVIFLIKYDYFQFYIWLIPNLNTFNVPCITGTHQFYCSLHRH